VSQTPQADSWVVVRCTKKMLDLLGSRNVTLSEPAPSDEDWYLNLLWIERQKCLLLTHSGTLFSVFRASVHVADLRPLGDYVVEAIETELRSEGLPAETFSQLGRRDIRVAKTASRSTLGFMKEMAFELEWHIAHDGGLDRTDINELNHALRRTLRSHGGDYAQPIELVDQHLTTRGRPAAAL
jgi:hypothetical protein